MFKSNVLKRISVLFLVTIMLAFASVSNIFAFALMRDDYILLEAYSYYQDGDGYGHSWITITNNTYYSYDLGHYYLVAGEVITISIWGNIPEHMGIWYNVESYAIDELDYYDGRVSVSKIISEDDLEEISSFLLSHNSYWGVYNCSSFTTDIWNLVCDDPDDELFCGWILNLPAFLCDSIKSKSTYYVNGYIRPSLMIGYDYNETFYGIIPDLTGSSSFSSGGS